MTIGTRRQFLRVLGAGGMVFVSLGVRPLGESAYAQMPVYRGASFLSAAYRGIRYGILGFIDQLQKNAQDVLKVEFFDSGSLVKADEQVSGLKVGTIQFMFHGTTYITQEFPILGVIELPGVCEHLYEHGERLAMESPLWDLINSELAKGNLFMLTAGGGIVQPEYIWSGSARIVSLEGLRGKRCRVMSHAATELLKSLDVNVVRISSEETYLALQRGSVDAVVAAVNTVVGRNLHEQLRFCLQIPLTAVTVAIFFRRDVWDKMPDREKAAFWNAGKWYDENQAKIGYKKITREEDWSVINKAGIQIVQPTDAERRIFMEKAQPVWVSWEKQVGEEIGRRAIDLATGRA